MSQDVSCIIPAHNEAARIGAVLMVVVGHPLVSEVLVIDDGSTDNTSKVAAAYEGVRLFTLTQNGGKAHAVAVGIREARGDVLLLLDADLEGLSQKDITALIEPVRSGAADIAISLRNNAPAPWKWIGLDYISGERVMTKEFMQPMLGGLSSLHGFGLEVYMNRAIVAHRLRIAVIWWGDVVSPLKFRKHGWRAGVAGDIRMMWHIFRVISPFEALRQIVTMSHLRR